MHCRALNPRTHTDLDELTWVCLGGPYTYVCLNSFGLWPLQNVPWRMRHMRTEQRPKWSVTAVFVHVATGCALQWSALVSEESEPWNKQGKGSAIHTSYIRSSWSACLNLWILLYVTWQNVLIFTSTVVSFPGFISGLSVQTFPFLSSNINPHGC